REGEHEARLDERPLRCLPVAGAADTARVAAEALVLHRGVEDCPQDAIALSGLVLPGRLDEFGVPGPHGLGGDFVQGNLLEAGEDIAAQNCPITLLARRRQWPSLHQPSVDPPPGVIPEGNLAGGRVDYQTSELLAAQFLDVVVGV